MLCVSGPDSSSLSLSGRAVFGDTKARRREALSVALLLGQDSLAKYWGQTSDGGLQSGWPRRGALGTRGAWGAALAAWGAGPGFRGERGAGPGRAGGRCAACGGLPHWDSRAGSLRTFLCHLY